MPHPACYLTPKFKLGYHSTTDVEIASFLIPICDKFILLSYQMKLLKHHHFVHIFSYLSPFLIGKRTTSSVLLCRVSLIWPFPSHLKLIHNLANWACFSLPIHSSSPASLFMTTPSCPLSFLRFFWTVGLLKAKNIYSDYVKSWGRSSSGWQGYI